MKKKLLIIPMLLPLLISCGGNNPNETKLLQEVIFNEVATGTNYVDQYFELLNITDKDIDLKEYKIAIYKSSGTDISVSIPLKGTLKAKETFVVTTRDSSKEIVTKANQVCDFKFNGSRAVRILKNNDVCDTLGSVGYSLSYVRNKTLLRRENKKTGKLNMDLGDFLDYGEDYFDNIGIVNPFISESELALGPRLTSEVFDLPVIYKKNNTDLGGGGVVKVSISSLGDGDTTHFDYHEDLREFDIYNGKDVRYLMIDTPEIPHGAPDDYGQPWGMAAKHYNNKKLRDARHIYVQFQKDGGIRETYGRLLGYIFISDKSNPKPEDFVCLNYQTVVDGYSRCNIVDNETLKYKGLTYSEFGRIAEINAKENGLGVHGQDPDWNYDTNRPK